MYAFTYHRATGLRHAANLLDKLEDPKILAGGQTLLPTMKHSRKESPKYSYLFQSTRPYRAKIFANDFAQTIFAPPDRSRRQSLWQRSESQYLFFLADG